MSNTSKPINKNDDSGKDFIKGLLEDKETRGFDIDSIYYLKSKRWVIIELLKCDTYNPFLSHPNKYSFNWRKFASLYSVNKKLNGCFLLVNYSLEEKKTIKIINGKFNSNKIEGLENNFTGDIKWRDVIKLMSVKSIDIETVKKRRDKNYLTTVDRYMTYEFFKKYFCEKINEKGYNPWEE